MAVAATAAAAAAASTSRTKKGEVQGWLPLGAFNSLAAAAARAEGLGGGGGGDGPAAGSGALGTAATLHPDVPPGAAVAALVRVAVE